MKRKGKKKIKVSRKKLKSTGRISKKIKQTNAQAKQNILNKPKYSKDLVRLARETLEKYFEGSTPEISDRLKRKYSDKAGIFVTLFHFKEQRGCIGFAEPMFPIWEGVVNASLGAAFNDPRHMPLSREELEECKIEVSIIEKPTPVKSIDEIEIGKHGLIVQKEHRTGLVLPEILTEYQTNAREALEMACRNAGLPQDCWKEKETLVLKFTTEKVKE